MIGNRICAIALTAAAAIIGSAPSAIAAPFDGNWSVVAQTTRGHCGSIQFGLAISGGRIYSTVALTAVTRRSWAAVSPALGMSR
jgi:hypothetical protein